MTLLPLRALPAAALAVAALAAGGAAASHSAREDDRVQLEVVGLLPLGEGGAALLVLRDQGTRTILPLVMRGADTGIRPGELRAPGLLAGAIEALGARVTEVEIDHPRASRSGATVRLVQGGRTLEVRGPPGQSVALAISAKVPIVTRRRVLDESGLTPEDLARVHREAKIHEERL